MSIRLSRVLTDRPLANAHTEQGVGAILYLLQRELIPIVRELVRALTAGPTAFAWDAGAATLDVSRGPDFVASSLLTSNSTLTFTAGYDGAQGSVIVQQDAVGARTLTIAVAGGTVLREAPSADSNPNPAPSSFTRYRYLFATVNGAPYLIVERLYLL